jgi:hypothetical protein
LRGIEERSDIMKILTFKRMIGLAAIGGVVYVHKQRGGTWTAESMKDTLRHLLSTAADKLGAASTEAQRGADRMASANAAATRSRISDEPKARTYGDFTKRSDDSGRH